MARTIVIGDIHNSYLALKELIEEKIIPTTDDTLIFLGDYTDGWNDTINTLKYLMELDRRFKCIWITGNHDSRFWGTMEYLLRGSANPGWLKHGGLVTKQALVEIQEDEPSFIDEALEFYSKFKPYHLDDQNRLFIHGGYSSKGGTATEDEWDFIWDRSLIQSALVSSIIAVEKPARLELYKEVYVGHTSTINLENALIHSKELEVPAWDFAKPLLLHNLVAVDTGAGWRGKLSAIEVDTKEIWQSTTVRDLYKEIDKEHFERTQ